MATKKMEDEGTAPVKKSFIALGNILGEPVTGADAAERAIAPHRLYRKGSKIELGEKDAARLLKIKAVKPVK